MVNCPQTDWKINQRSWYILLNSAFWGWLSVESHPQNPEFRNNLENFHPSRWASSWDLCTNCRDFPKPDLGPNIAPSQLKYEQKLPKMLYIILNFLVLHFGKNFMKIRTKIAKLQIHENLRKNVNMWTNENMFSFTFLCKFSWVLWRVIKATNMLQLYTAYFNLLKMSKCFLFWLQYGRKLPELHWWIAKA